MQTAKQEALEAIERLPDDADTEEIIYRLYVLENIRRGQQDAAEGKKPNPQKRCSRIFNHGEVDLACQTPASPHL